MSCRVKFRKIIFDKYNMPDIDLFFFFPGSYVFFSCFFFFLEKFKFTHSLVWKVRFFFSGRGKKKKQLFCSLTRIYPKIHKIQTFPGKKKKRYLWWKWVKVSESEVKWRIFLSPISLKLSTFKDQDKYIFEIFVVSDFAQKIWQKNPIQVWKSGKIYKGFPCKKFCPGESFVKWTQIKIKGNSFVKFSAGGLRSIYKEIPL